MDQELEIAIGHVIKKNRRSLGQNALMWSLIGDISSQVEWHGQKLSKKDWKWIFTAAIRRQRIVPGIDGGMVYLGEPTSGMSKQEMADLIEMIYAFGAEHGVEWADPL
jgi:hypothetical protein